MFRGQGTRTVNTNEDLLTDRLRTAWQAPAAGPPLPDHPAAEKIWDAVAGRLAPEAISRVVDHVALCAECAEEWRLAMVLEREKLDETAPPGTVIPMPLRPARATWWDPRWAAAAALVVGAIGLSVFLPKSGQESPYRGGEAVKVESLVRDNAPVTRAGFKLQWKPVPGAVSYDLALKNSNLKIIFSVTGLTQPEYDVPAEKLTSVPPATHLLWQVVPVFADGTKPSSTMPFRLTLVE